MYKIRYPLEKEINNEVLKIRRKLVVSFFGQVERVISFFTRIYYKYRKEGVPIIIKEMIRHHTINLPYFMESNNLYACYAIPSEK